MPVYKNVNNVIKETEQIHTNVAGTVKEVETVQGNVAGVNKELYSSAPSGTQDYTVVGVYTFTVPEKTTELRYEISGGAGGKAGYYKAYNYSSDTTTTGVLRVTANGLTTPAKGELKAGVLAVTPGQELSIVVGAKAEKFEAENKDRGVGLYTYEGSGCTVLPKTYIPPNATYPNSLTGEYLNIRQTPIFPTYRMGVRGGSGTPTSLGELVATGGGTPNPAKVAINSSRNPVALSLEAHASHSTNYTGSVADGYVKLSWGRAK